MYLQVIFVFKSSSSLDLDHHSIWIIIGHRHWIWIITGSRSSLLDHHYWIITRAISLFFSAQEVLQSQPFFMLVVGLPIM